MSSAAPGRSLALGAALLVAVLGALGWWWLRASPAPAQASGPQTEAPRARADDAELEQPAPPVERAEVAPAAAPEPAPIAAAPAPAVADAPLVHRVHGRVYSVDGAPLAGVAIGADTRPQQVLATSAADGWFEVQLPDRNARLCDAAAEWATYCTGAFFTSNPDRELLVIVAPSLELAGYVVDDAGAPIAGANVACEIGMGTLTGFPLPIHTTEPVGFHSTSAANGAFELHDVPAAPGLAIATRAPGFEQSVTALPQRSDTALRIVLEREHASEQVVRGIVVHADGRPAAGARVTFANAEASADDLGQFELSVENATVDREVPLVAALAGYQAALRPNFYAELEQSRFQPAPLRLVLGPPALWIRGSALDAEGHPLVGWKVALIDATLITRGAIPIRSAERLCDESARGVTTDSAGRFAIGGLAARAYRLKAYEPKSVLNLASDPIEAGSVDVVLQLAADALVPRVSGLVVARDGTPIRNATVAITYVTESAGFASTSANGGSTRTASDGSFELQRVPRRGIALTVGSDETIPLSRNVDELDLDEQVVLTPARRFHLRVEGGPRENGIGIGVLDAREQELTLMIFQSNGWMSTSRNYLSDGASPTMAVSEDAAWIQFYDRTGEGQGLRALTLRPGDVTVVRY
ncbi:MAG: carboxypeptidase regulatory-like domain-containing protein [Planctomycetota bacterium]|nr:MAG: carboxypeptidase regulatory-like domain-containing protein [Planctomycetota bacterium]